jgi:long-subunit acyl-CoA synthetase (AMP-forming)
MLAPAVARIFSKARKMISSFSTGCHGDITFGANHNFNLVLRNGGSLYIDGGKPAPGLFATSLANLRSVMPTVYFNVPRGFFGEVKFAFYAGAALPQNLWDAIEELAIRTVGRALPMVSAWGSTETSPLATDCHFQAQRSGNIGVPIPGTELKLVPSGDKLEVRVRGPNVTPGYWKAPELTAQAFDMDGFYLIGDAGRRRRNHRQGLYQPARGADAARGCRGDAGRRCVNPLDRMRGLKRRAA